MVFYITTISISILLIAGLNIIFTSASLTSSIIILLATLLGTIVVILIDALFAWLTTKLPEKFYSDKLGIYKVSKKETKLYEKLGIRKWKDKIWELGKLNGFSKAKVEDPKNPEYVKRFLLESKIGMLDHILGMVLGFFVILILPNQFALRISLPVAIINLVLNLPSLMILRYNKPKLEILLKRTLRQQNALNEDINSNEKTIKE